MMAFLSPVQTLLTFNKTSLYFWTKCLAKFSDVARWVFKRSQLGIQEKLCVLNYKSVNGQVILIPNFGLSLLR